MPAEKSIAVNHMDMFPTRIWSVSLSMLDEYIPSWVKAIEAMRVANPTPAGRSNRLGWNSAPTLFNDPLFAPLQEAVRGIFDFVFDQMGPPHYPYHLEAWANVHDLGGYNAYHYHAGALLSACYYLQVPEGSGFFTIRDPRQGALLSTWNSNAPNGGHDANIFPQTGQLIIFPSWLEHGAEAHTGSNPRISIPINATLPVGKAS